MPPASRVWLVFAASARLNAACPSIRLLVLDPGTLALAPLEPARADFPGQCVLRGEGRCAFPLDREPAKIAVELTDFAHAGTRLDPFGATAERRATRGILAPILTHVTWSVSMLFLLPWLFG